MAWFRCDDRLGDHPKVMALDEKLLPAMGLWTLCGVYASKHLTDGFVPRKVVRMYGGDRLAKELERVGLFKPAHGGWTMHDYLDWNPSKEQVLEIRSKRQASGQAGGRASGQARAQANASPLAQANPNPVPVPGPTPVPDVLSNVLGKGSATDVWLEPSDIYRERTGRKSLSQKERDWIDDLHVRFSRTQLAAALYAVPNPRETNYLKRVDDYLERAA
jgi:hypothetical protein